MENLKTYTEYVNEGIFSDMKHGIKKGWSKKFNKGEIDDIVENIFTKIKMNFNPNNLISEDSYFTYKLDDVKSKGDGDKIKVGTHIFELWINEDEVSRFVNSYLKDEIVEFFYKKLEDINEEEYKKSKNDDISKIRNKYDHKYTPPSSRGYWNSGF
jgi:hypothetical protein